MQCYSRDLSLCVNIVTPPCTVAVPRWISGKVSGDRPPPCSYNTLTLVDTRRAVMFGGNTKTGRVNDIYVMTLDGMNVVINLKTIHNGNRKTNNISLSRILRR